MRSPELIRGDVFQDERGSLRFANTFDMKEIVRFYEIAPASQQSIRAWQGHVHEKKWFYCLSGSFVINLIAVDDFKNPSKTLIPIKFGLDTTVPHILYVPGGFATGIKATSDHARLQVFSNVGLNESKNDDFRFPLETWSATW
jgi:dTDP-4-dehydrorhamnose 3,5-epimerase